MHRLAAQFYNLNATKDYLSISIANPGSGTTPGADIGTGPTGTPGAGIAGTGTGVTPPQDVGTGADTGASTGASLAALRSMVEEIRAHHNQHVTLIEQRLGTNTPVAPTFQNLDAPTLQQFLSMAQMIEDVSVSANAGMVPEFQDRQLLAFMAAIGLVEGRHAGAIRAWRKAASTALGGDPNLTLTEDGQPLNPARTREQVMALIQPFVGGATVTPGANPVSGGSTGNGTSTGSNSGTGGSTGNPGTGSASGSY
jgi:hypothetical protein